MVTKLLVSVAIKLINFIAMILLFVVLVMVFITTNNHMIFIASGTVGRPWPETLSPKPPRPNPNLVQKSFKTQLVPRADTKIL